MKKVYIGIGTHKESNLPGLGFDGQCFGKGTQREGEQARNYILSTNEPLKVIAARVGFASENHLSRLLKENFGIGARQMRSLVN